MKRFWNAPKKSKYNAKKVTINGITFPSKKEADRYLTLQTLRKANEVDFFLMQVPFHLPGKTKYYCDFVVFWKSGRVSFEDVKGVKTDVFQMKKRMVEDLYNVEIECL